MPTSLAASHSAAVPEGADLVAIAVRPADLGADASVDVDVVKASGFEGKVGQTMFAATDDGLRLLVGIGDTPDPPDYRKSGAAVAKAAKDHGSVAISALADLAGADRASAAQALAEGLILGTYRF